MLFRSAPGRVIGAPAQQVLRLGLCSTIHSEICAMSQAEGVSKRAEGEARAEANGGGGTPVHAAYMCAASAQSLHGQAGGGLAEGDTGAVFRVHALHGIRRGLNAVAAADGQVHVTQCMQLSGMRGGDKLEWSFKLLMCTVIDTLFVRLMHRSSNPTPGNLQQGAAFIRYDNKAAVDIMPPWPSRWTLRLLSAHASPG
eukprot:2807892-Pleurochrysis_carterae.AAC.2